MSQFDYISHLDDEGFDLDNDEDNAALVEHLDNTSSIPWNSSNHSNPGMPSLAVAPMPSSYITGPREDWEKRSNTLT